jgi:hypothetical protein
MRFPFWPVLPPVPDFEAVESRFPAGTRSGEGSDSLRVYLESARRTRIHATSGPSSTRHGTQRATPQRSKGGSHE